MDAEDTCDVVVLGFDAGTEPPAERLQRAFGIARETAEALLARLPATVQRGVSRVRADYFRRGLIAIGAQVEVRTQSGLTVPFVVGAPPATEPALAATEPPAAAAPAPGSSATPPSPSPATPAPVFAWSAPATPEPPAPVAARAIDAMSATLAQLGAVRVEDLRSPSPQHAQPRSQPPVVAGRPSATLREAVPAPAFMSGHSAPPRFAGIELPARPAHPTALGHGAAAAGATSARPPVAARALEAVAPAAHGHAGFEPQLHVSRDQSSVFDPPPARAPLPPRPQAITLPSAETDGSPPAPAAAAGMSSAAHAFGGLAGLALPGAPLANAGYASSGSGPVAPAPAAFMFDLAPVAVEPIEAGLPMHQPAGVELAIGGDTPGQRLLQAWEQPDAHSLAEPGVMSSHPPLSQRALAQSPRERLLPESLRSPRDEAGSQPAPAPAVGVADRSHAQARAVVPYDPRTFWESLGDALLLPFSGPGPYWIGAIAGWSVMVAAIGLLCRFMFLPGLVISFIAQTSLVAFACDYYRVCLWQPIVGEKALDLAPNLDPVRILDRYVRSGLNLSFFAIASQIPVIAWLAASAYDGRNFVELLTDPVSWALFAFPYVYWPMGVGLAALANDFSMIWNVPAGLRSIARAPLEYMLIVVIGLGTLGVTWLVLFLGSSLLGATGAVLGGAIGVPLAISHGIQGALMGHLARARSEVFE